MTKIKKILAIAVSSLAIIAVAVAYSAPTSVVEAGNDLNNTSRVGELLVLDGLFGEGRSGDEIGDTSRIGELLVLDGLFGDGSGIL